MPIRASSYPVGSPATNPWKAATIAIVALLASALIVGIVVASFRASPSEPVKSNPVAAPRQAAPPAVAAAQKRPAASDIEQCNAVANDDSAVTDTLKKAAIGGLVGAGVGAAGGAIADGGSGAGKGAGIGGLVGAAAGTLYGLNENKKNDERAAQAYRECMARRGF